VSERRSIHALSPSLVNRIAAGEVVERPASVVKELVENSLDAGATRIEIHIGDGGRDLIRIVDNGAGIPPEELPLAFASHATSKLTCDDDLFRIATMGFRGEALASIGSVSHAVITSRTADSEAAYEIRNIGGEITQPQATAGNIGTIVEVRNLFFNTPARRKFLKGTATEFGHISEAVMRLALPFPQVAFVLSHNGRVQLDLPASDAALRRLAAWPTEFAPLGLPISVRDAEIELTGVIGLPELARPTAKHQYLYLNGRSIRDRSIQHALREAYRGLTEPGRHPAAILMLRMPPADVDVNVHPSKTEVRFRDSGRMHGLIHAAVREKLLGSDLSPHAVRLSSGEATATPEISRPDLRQRLADFFRGELPAGMSDQPPTPTIPSPVTEPMPAHTTAPTFEQYPAAPRAQIVEPIRPSWPSNNSPISEPQAAPRVEAIGSSSPSQQPQTFPDASSAIQLHNSYLVVQSEDGMLIIDQHALHERIVFEDLLARVNRGPLESQRLLIPLTLPASGRQIVLLEQIQPLLHKIGIEATAFGPETVAVQGFPSFLSKLDPVEFVAELLERGEQELLDLHEEALLHEVLDMMACKAAVKAGDPLSQQEIAALLARRHLVDRASNCPHGRPTTLRLSLRELEKQFKRTGF
jgi:DNA mismatch repair protein MutL